MDDPFINNLIFYHCILMWVWNRIKQVFIQLFWWSTGHVTIFHKEGNNLLCFCFFKSFSSHKILFFILFIFLQIKEVALGMFLEVIGEFATSIAEESVQKVRTLQKIADEILQQTQYTTVDGLLRLQFKSLKKSSIFFSFIKSLHWFKLEFWIKSIIYFSVQNISWLIKEKRNKIKFVIQR